MGFYKLQDKISTTLKWTFLTFISPVSWWRRRRWEQRTCRWRWSSWCSCGRRILLAPPSIKQHLFSMKWTAGSKILLGFSTNPDNYMKHCCAFTCTVDFTWIGTLWRDSYCGYLVKGLPWQITSCSSLFPLGQSSTLSHTCSRKNFCDQQF